MICFSTLIAIVLAIYFMIFWVKNSKDHEVMRTKIRGSIMPECHLPKGVNIAGMSFLPSQIRGVNIPGIGGQHQTEWGVNTERNVHLSGVLMAIVCVVFLANNLSKYSDLIDEVNEELSLLELEIDFAKQKIEEFKSEAEKDEKQMLLLNIDNRDSVSLEERLISLKDKEHRALLEFIYRNFEWIFPEFLTGEEIKLHQAKVSELSQQLSMKLKRIMLKNKSVENFRKKILIHSFFWGGGTGIGIYLAVYGFILWYKRVQKPLDEKLKRELAKL